MAAHIELFEMAHETPSRADDFFRYHDQERTEVESDGDVEAPTGHFTLRKVERVDIVDYTREHGDPWITEKRNFETGWYIDVRDSNGIIHAYFYGGDATMPEEYARADFAKLQEKYSEWDSQDDEPDTNPIADILHSCGLNFDSARSAGVEWLEDEDGQLTFWIKVPS